MSRQWGRTDELLVCDDLIDKRRFHLALGSLTPDIAAFVVDPSPTTEIVLLLVDKDRGLRGTSVGVRDSSLFGSFDGTERLRFDGRVDFR
jgi:hypothetical protein